jgi:general secretion pathway protein I
MKKIEIKKFKTAPDLAKMIEEGHKVHAMANGKIQSYERHTPQPEDYSNLDDFMEVAENHINELYNTRQEVDEMLTEVFTVFVRHPELSGTPYITVLELMVFLEEDFRQLTKRYEAASSALAATAVLQTASGALSNQQILEEKTVAGWVAENQTALLYLMTREQRAVRHQGESDMAGSRWYWRTTPLNTGNALLQAVDIEVSLHEDFSSVIQSRRAWFSAVGGQQ